LSQTLAESADKISLVQEQGEPGDSTFIDGTTQPPVSETTGKPPQRQLPKPAKDQKLKL
jgi:hypothetical protein